MGLLSSLGRAATSKVGTAAIIGGAATAGFLKHTAPAARDAAMDVAFDDPNADESFLGRKLTPGAVFDAAAPGGRSGTAALGLMGAGAALGGAARSIPSYENTWLFRQGYGNS